VCVPFCPTLASSWNQISIGVPAVQESSASFSRLGKFMGWPAPVLPAA